MTNSNNQFRKQCETLHAKMSQDMLPDNFDNYKLEHTYNITQYYNCLKFCTHYIKEADLKCNSLNGNIFKKCILLYLQYIQKISKYGKGNISADKMTEYINILGDENMVAFNNDYMDAVIEPILNIALDEECNLLISKELLRNLITISKLIKYEKRLRKAKMHIDKIIQLGKYLLSCGDIEYQRISLEFILRMTHKNRVEFGTLLFANDKEIREAFINIDLDEFVRATRTFLLIVNNKYGSVISIKCRAIALNDLEQVKGDDLTYLDLSLKSKNLSFNINFNVCHLSDDFVPSFTTDFEDIVFAFMDCSPRSNSFRIVSKRLQSNYTEYEEILSGNEIAVTFIFEEYCSYWRMQLEEALENYSLQIEDIAIGNSTSASEISLCLPSNPLLYARSTQETLNEEGSSKSTSSRRKRYSTRNIDPLPVTIRKRSSSISSSRSTISSFSPEIDFDPSAKEPHAIEDDTEVSKDVKPCSLETTANGRCSSPCSVISISSSIISLDLTATPNQLQVIPDDIVVSKDIEPFSVKQTNENGRCSSPASVISISSSISDDLTVTSKKLQVIDSDTAIGKNIEPLSVNEWIQNGRCLSPSSVISSGSSICFEEVPEVKVENGSQRLNTSLKTDDPQSKVNDGVLEVEIGIYEQRTQDLNAPKFTSDSSGNDSSTIKVLVEIKPQENNRETDDAPDLSNVEQANYTNDETCKDVTVILQNPLQPKLLRIGKKKVEQCLEEVYTLDETCNQLSQALNDSRQFVKNIPQKEKHGNGILNVPNLDNGIHAKLMDDESCDEVVITVEPLQPKAIPICKENAPAFSQDMYTDDETCNEISITLIKPRCQEVESSRNDIKTKSFDTIGDSQMILSNGEYNTCDEMFADHSTQQIFSNYETCSDFIEPTEPVTKMKSYGTEVGFGGKQNSINNKDEDRNSYLDVDSGSVESMKQLPSGSSIASVTTNNSLENRILDSIDDEWVDNCAEVMNPSNSQDVLLSSKNASRQSSNEITNENNRKQNTMNDIEEDVNSYLDEDLGSVESLKQLPSVLTVESVSTNNKETRKNKRLLNLNNASNLNSASENNADNILSQNNTPITSGDEIPKEETNDYKLANMKAIVPAKEQTSKDIVRNIIVSTENKRKTKHRGFQGNALDEEIPECTSKRTKSTTATSENNDVELSLNSNNDLARSPKDGHSRKNRRLFNLNNASNLNSANKNNADNILPRNNTPIASGEEIPKEETNDYKLANTKAIVPAKERTSKDIVRNVIVSSENKRKTKHRGFQGNTLDGEIPECTSNRTKSTTATSENNDVELSFNSNNDLARSPKDGHSRKNRRLFNLNNVSNLNSASESNADNILSLNNKPITSGDEIPKEETNDYKLANTKAIVPAKEQTSKDIVRNIIVSTENKRKTKHRGFQGNALDEEIPECTSKRTKSTTATSENNDVELSLNSNNDLARSPKDGHSRKNRRLFNLNNASNLNSANENNADNILPRNNTPIASGEEIPKEETNDYKLANTKAIVPAKERTSKDIVRNVIVSSENKRKTKHRGFQGNALDGEILECTSNRTKSTTATSENNDVELSLNSNNDQKKSLPKKPENRRSRNSSKLCNVSNTTNDKPKDTPIINSDQIPKKGTGDCALVNAKESDVGNKQKSKDIVGTRIGLTENKSKSRRQLLKKDSRTDEKTFKSPLKKTKSTPATTWRRSVYELNDANYEQLEHIYNASRYLNVANENNGENILLPKNKPTTNVEQMPNEETNDSKLANSKAIKASMKQTPEDIVGNKIDSTDAKRKFSYQMFEEKSKPDGEILECPLKKIKSTPPTKETNYELKSGANYERTKNQHILLQKNTPTTNVDQMPNEETNDSKLANSKAIKASMKQTPKDIVGNKIDSTDAKSKFRYQMFEEKSKPDGEILECPLKKIKSTPPTKETNYELKSGANYERTKNEHILLQKNTPTTNVDQMPNEETNDSKLADSKAIEPLKKQTPEDIANDKISLTNTERKNLFQLFEKDSELDEEILERPLKKVKSTPPTSKETNYELKSDANSEQTKSVSKSTKNMNSRKNKKLYNINDISYLNFAEENIPSSSCLNINETHDISPEKSTIFVDKEKLINGQIIKKKRNIKSSTWKDFTPNKKSSKRSTTLKELSQNTAFDQEGNNNDTLLAKFDTKNSKNSKVSTKDNSELFMHSKDKIKLPAKRGAKSKSTSCKKYKKIDRKIGGTFKTNDVLARADASRRFCKRFFEDLKKDTSNCFNHHSTSDKPISKSRKILDCGSNKINVISEIPVYPPIPMELLELSDKTCSVITKKKLPVKDGIPNEHVDPDNKEVPQIFSEDHVVKIMEHTFAIQKILHANYSADNNILSKIRYSFENTFGNTDV